MRQPKTVRTAFRLSEDQLERLESLADHHDVPVSQVIRWLIDEAPIGKPIGEISGRGLAEVGPSHRGNFQTA